MFHRAGSEERMKPETIALLPIAWPPSDVASEGLPLVFEI